jgi:hypothetical protein
VRCPDLTVAFAQQPRLAFWGGLHFFVVQCSKTCQS